MRRVLLDTSGIFAYVATRDANHEAARTLVRRLAEENGRLVVLDLVFAEAMTLLRSRLNTSAALRMGNSLRTSPFYEWMPLGRDGEQETWQVFQEYEDKTWSFVDCALLAMSRHLRIPEVFSFDGHFSQMREVRRIPRG